MTAIVSENLLHLLGPYLPTDRFRALLAGRDLEEHATGAAMIVDISGFTPLTVKLVEQYGPQRASEELKRRLNPMFEAVAGQVFTHGGSVIRFVGDGFTAWFSDTVDHVEKPLPGVVRAAVAARQMLEMMVFFRDLDIKVAVFGGQARRWVVGDPQLGLVDVLTGTAVEGVADISTRYERHDARVNRESEGILCLHPEITFTKLEDGDLLVTAVENALVETSRSHRWPAWIATQATETVIEKVRQFIDPLILEQESSGLGSIAGELRYATPAFLKFAGLDYNNDPQARQQLDNYVQDVQNILKEARGRLVSLEVGDKGSVIFAVFGAPVAYGDDSQRAIHTALSFRELPSIHPTITSQSIGISRGLLYSGTVGGEVRHEYTSLGDETNVASRLMSADEKGEIYVSEAVYEECQDWFEFKPGEVVYPKGRMGNIQTYIPVRVRRFRRSLRKTPIVGREKELEIIQKALTFIKEGKPRIIRIEGDAGIGKSRLAAELIHLAENDNGKVASGFCISTGKTIAFLAWRPVIRAITGVQAEWSDAAEIAHLEKWLPAQNPEWAVRLPLLGDLLGIEIPDNATTRNLTGNARQQALFALVIDILYLHAQHAPLTLVIEDTHWLDEVSEALLTELASRLMIEPTGILLVLLHRPAEEAEHPTTILKALGEMYIHRHMLLNELSNESVEQLLETRLKGKIPPELTHFVFEKSQGNPFFVQEILAVLQDANAITRVGPQVYIDASLEKSNLPQTVQGLIQARIDNLSETEKLILKLGAVIGRQFEVRVLYQSLPISGMTPQAVMSHLRVLEKHRFTQLEALHPEPIFSFRHAITQEVTYQTLLHDQRRQWHRTVGGIIETLAPHQVERLAYHFALSDDTERALVYLVRAGDKSAHEFANLAALDYWGRALQLARSPKEQFDLLCKRLEVLMRIGDRAATQTDLEQLLKLAETAPNNQNWQIRTHRYQAENLLELGQWEQARQLAEAAIKRSKNYENPSLEWELYSILMRLYALLNQPDAQKQAALQLREVSQKLNEPAKALRLKLNDLFEQARENSENVQAELENAYTEIKDLADPMLEANYWNIRSRIAMQNQDYPKAKNFLRTQLGLWRQVGNRRLEGQTLNDLGTAQYALGQYSHASAHLSSSYKILNQIGDKWGESKSLVYLGIIAFRRNAFGEANAYIRRGLAYQESMKMTQDVLHSLYFLGQCELAQKNFEAARTYLYKALNTALEANIPIETMPQLQLSVAYTQARSSTLPMIEDFRATIDKLIGNELIGFHDPDIAFWEAHILLSVFMQPTAPLYTAFKQYIETRLATLTEETDRAAFLALGFTPKLLNLLK